MLETKNRKVLDGKTTPHLRTGCIYSLDQFSLSGYNTLFSSIREINVPAESNCKGSTIRLLLPPPIAQTGRLDHRRRVSTVGHLGGCHLQTRAQPDPGRT